MTTLRSTVDSSAMEKRVADAWCVAPESVGAPSAWEDTVVYEHGQWWVMTYDGAVYSVHDEVPGIDGFGFEKVSEGDRG